MEKIFFIFTKYRSYKITNIEATKLLGVSRETFFDSVRMLYNLAFFKEEKGYRAEAVKKYANELFQANRISEYIHSIIEEAIQKFTLLLPGNLKKMAPNLENLDQWITISICDINSEITELMSH